MEVNGGHHDKRLLSACTKVLAGGLALESGRSLYVIAQAGPYQQLAEGFAVAAEQMGLSAHVEVFAPEVLHDGAHDRPEKKRWIEFARAHDAIVLLSEWSPETTLGRLDVLTRMCEDPQGKRIASMPGVSSEMLRSCRINYASVIRKSLDVFASMVRSESRFATVITSRPQCPRDCVTLHIPFDANHLPIVSTGQIVEGAWGNCPSGETFLCPRVEGVAGEVYITGSLPNRVLEAGEWCLLSIENGRVQHPIRASSDALGRYAESLLFRANSSRPIDRDSNAIGEFGVGTNEAVKVLTGNPVFDEKALGTIHLGIGNNRQFRGDLKSSVHHDLVVRDPTLTIDHTALIVQGRYCLSRSAAAPRAISVGVSDPRADSILSLGEAGVTSEPHEIRDAYVLDDGKQHGVYAVYRPRRGHIIAIRLAHGPDGQRILDVVRKLRDGPARVAELEGGFGAPWSQVKFRRLVSGLCAYRVLQVMA